MDPTVVLKLVREQKRQINDTFNTTQQQKHQLTSPSSSSSSSSNSNSPNPPIFQTPPPPPPLQRNQRLQQSSPNLTAFNLVAGQAYLKTQHFNSPILNKNQMYYYNTNPTAAKNSELEYLISQNNNPVKSAYAPSSQLNYLPNKNLINQDNYYNIQPRLTPPSLVDASLSRSASVKSVASDSGLGSSSPMSDCSDYNPGKTEMSLKNFKTPQSSPQTFHHQIMKRRKNSYEESIYLQQQQGASQPKQLIKSNSDVNLINEQFNLNSNANSSNTSINNNISNLNSNNNNNNNNKINYQIHNHQQSQQNNHAQQPKSINQNSAFSSTSSSSSHHNHQFHPQPHATSQYCDKECCSHLSKLNSHPATTAHYCDCKECNELVYMTNKPRKPYCDCPQCNAAIAKETKQNLPLLVTPTPIMPNPSVNRFMISSNSSFSPIGHTNPPSPHYLPYPPNTKQKNFPIRKDIPYRQPIPNPYSLPSNQAYCPCADCLKSNFMHTTPRHLSKHPGQVSLTSNPVQLASEYPDLNNNSQNIIKQKNTFYSEDANDLNKFKRKLDEPQMHLQQQLKENEMLEGQINYKKNRLINYANDTYLYQQQQQQQSSHVYPPKVVQPLVRQTSNLNLSKPTDDDLELGEVVSIEKLAKNTESECDPPVTIPKKLLPIVTTRIHDWLERSVEFSHRISLKTSIPMEKIFSLLIGAWPKLLLVYMMENSFDFYVTKDTNTAQYETNSSANINLPKEKDADQLHNIIKKGNEFSLDTQEYDLLREIILFNEGGDELIYSKPCYEARKLLQEKLVDSSNKEFGHIFAFLPSIYSIKTGIIENLFCKSLNNSKTVYEFLNKKLKDILVEQEEKTDIVK